MTELVRLGPGDKAPAFELEDQTGATVKLSDFAGQCLLIYFYPKANTPGCTKQSCAVRDAMPDLGSLGARAVGISPDAPAAQARFDTKYGLGFPLLSDVDHAAAVAYGVWSEKSMYGKTFLGIVRSAFLVDAQGTLREVWYKISPTDTVPFAKAALGKP